MDFSMQFADPLDRARAILADLNHGLQAQKVALPLLLGTEAALREVALLLAADPDRLDALELLAVLHARLESAYTLFLGPAVRS